MSDFWKGVFAVLGLQWLFGGNSGGGCGCGGCLMWIILGLCMIFYLLGIL